LHIDGKKWNANSDAYRIWWESHKERDHYEHLDVGGRRLKETGWGGMDWFGLAQGRDWWRTIVNMVINLGVP
jgi:hypothetical protein